MLVGRQQGPLGHFLNDLLDSIGEMIAIVEQEDSPAPPSQEEREERHVGLGRIAGRAGEDQVVGPIVGRLPSSGANVVQGDVLQTDRDPAVGADRSVLGEQPVSVGLV